MEIPDWVISFPEATGHSPRDHLRENAVAYSNLQSVVASVSCIFSLDIFFYRYHLSLIQVFGAAILIITACNPSEGVS